MYVLLDHATPFLLAHGNYQTLIEFTRHALQRAGVDVEWLRWWDDKQHGQIIHYFGRPSVAYLNFAHEKKMKVVMTELVVEQDASSPTQRRLQKFVRSAAQDWFPESLRLRVAEDSYRLADAFIALTPSEAQWMTDNFGAPPGQVHTVPHGVEDGFLRSLPEKRGPWLVCTAALTASKRVVELAQAAIQAQTPLWVIGVPDSSNDPYAQEFLVLARDHPKFIRYEGGIRDRKVLSHAYRQARGFVLLSERESLCVSPLEAAACECPLLLCDLPWARASFGEQATYCPVSSVSATAQRLRAFYDQAPQLPAPAKPKSWDQIGERLCGIYEVVLGLPPRRSLT